ncbi:protein of unknown function DUF86 [Methanocaldococcus vulcanius M7]|uniref:DUF86 domain-containing protein n=1 Tax=Methanocaldococcus vulcanius (strain ATCC 700851 / DSM 12094 / M7) TaxID=579137 RepID=C9RFB1_METVM|nr:DUF86 domain-containing protein [Methanocaldococcus vulcanius]ACX72263.1 protein of unknown function DUF86 [Methanocaldococcus vulcanius M7]
MSKKDVRAFLYDILENMKDIIDFTKDMDYDEFLKDKKTQKAVIRSLEVIGEAVKNLPEDFINKYPQVPWKGMARLRDKLIHHYFGINYEIIWDIVINKVPNDIKEFEKIIKDIEGEDENTL